jgi:hypothetical protein
VYSVSAQAGRLVKEPRFRCAFWTSRAAVLDAGVDQGDPC